VHEAESILRPAKDVDVEQMARTFTLRTSEGFVETFGPALLARVSNEAPRVKLRFIQKPDKDAEPLREGRVDLETGVVVVTTGPELRTQALFRDRWIGVVRAKHTLSQGRITTARYASAQHVDVWRGPGRGPIDDALERLGLEREVVASFAGGFATAVALARASDLIASVPEHHTARLREGMHSFLLPVTTPEFTVSLLWHPRLDADSAHRWLRDCVRDVCTSEVGRLSGRRVGRRTTGRSA
jgi:DNA-binding transcriptional LysR family regulator